MTSFFADQMTLPKTLEEVREEEVPRDKWKRPLIRQPDGSMVAYNRASSYGGQLEDKSNLELWGKRQMLRGAAIDPTILDRVPQGPARERGGEIDTRDKRVLNALVEQADEAVGSQDKAALGTAIHAATEFIDLGESLDGLSPLLRNRADAYYKVIREYGFDYDAIEEFAVHDELKVAGTFDRRGFIPFWPEHRQTIADVKTSSSLDFAGIGFAVQLAVYAHMELYNFRDGSRTPHEDMNLDRALIIHVSREMGGPVTLAEVDIKAGAAQAHLAREVILARRIGTKSIREIEGDEAAILAARSRAELRHILGDGTGWSAKLRELANARWTNLPKD